MRPTRPLPRRLALAGALAAAVSLVSGLACATPPPPTSQPTTRASEELATHVRALLANPKQRSSADAWRSLGPGALTVLHQIAADTAEVPDRRAAAVGAMALVDDPGASPTLTRFATDPNAQVPLRQSAILALARRDGPASEGTLAPLLADASTEVRHAAAEALGLAGGAEARSALQARLDAESDPAVREEIQRSLAKTNN